MLYDSQRLGLPNREETIKAPILADGSLNKIILNLWSKNLYTSKFSNSLLSVNLHRPASSRTADDTVRLSKY